MMVVDVVVALAMSENCVGCFTACVTPGDAGTASLLVFSRKLAPGGYIWINRSGCGIGEAT